jgi:hypothetical protein
VSNKKVQPTGVADLDSVLQPLVDELEILAAEGVAAKHGVHDTAINDHVIEDFRLKARLIGVSGDMPAIAEVRLNAEPQDNVVSSTDPHNVCSRSYTSKVIHRKYLAAVCPRLSKQFRYRCSPCHLHCSVNLHSLGCKSKHSSPVFSGHSTRPAYQRGIY